MLPIIAGIDPGTTSAFAALSFDFKVLCVRSRKEYSLSSIISDIYKVGNPVIVATDKKEVPSFIREFSQRTGAKVYSPRYDTKKGEKKVIVRNSGFSYLVKNTHETDALASAIFAFNEHRPLLRKIISYVEKNNKHEIKDRIISLTILKDKSIADAVAEIERKPEKKPEPLKVAIPVIERKKSKEEKEIMLLYSLIKKLRNGLLELKKENSILRAKRIDINQETKKMLSYKEKRILSLEKENRMLRKQLRIKEKTMKKMDSFILMEKNSTLLKKLDNLGSEGLSRLRNILKIERGDILLVKDLSVLSQEVVEEIKENVQIIIYEKGRSRKLEEDFILIERDNLVKAETRHFALADRADIEERKENVLKERKKKRDYLLEIVQQYRRERLSDKIE